MKYAHKRFVKAVERSNEVDVLSQKKKGKKLSQKFFSDLGCCTKTKTKAAMKGNSTPLFFSDQNGTCRARVCVRE